MGDEELYYDILQTYYEQGLGYRERLKELYEACKWKEYAVIVHAIKSTSLNIGAQELSWKAKMMEQDAKEEKEESIQQHWEEFLNLYTMVLERAAELLKENNRDLTVTDSEKEKRFVSKELYLQECKELLEHIRAYEMQEAVDKLEELKGMRFPDENATDEETLTKVLDAVNEFTYDEAERLLVSWLERNE